MKNFNENKIQFFISFTFVAGILLKQLDEFVDYVTDLVEPKKRADLNLKKWHKTQLTGSKIKTQSKKKKKSTKKKSKHLSRSEYTELGLYALPTKSLKYSDAMPMNELWLQYIYSHLRQYLTERNGKYVIPEIHDSNYDAFSKSITKSDFHGAMISVIASCNQTLVGQMGIVVMETRNTFKIVSKDDRIRSK